MTELDEQSERWLPIEEWPGYDVSDMGRARSWWGAGSGRQGRRAITDSPKLIGGYKAKSGHLQVVLYRNGSSETRRAGIHILVLEAFVGPRPPGMVVCHNDGNPSNNRVGNLRWDTYSANQRDALKHGVHGTAILSEDSIPLVWREIVSGKSPTEIARDLDIPVSAVTSIRCGTTWTHVTRNLPGWPLIRPTDADGKEPIYIDPMFCEPHVESWASIDGWPAYRFSSFGRVQSRWERVTGGKRGEFRLGETWKDRAIYPNKDGHYFLWMSNGVDRKMKYLHQLILTAFACERPEGYVGCHIDGNKSNNRASNLRWDTIKSNARDRVRHAKKTG